MRTVSVFRPAAKAYQYYTTQAKRPGKPWTIKAGSQLGSPIDEALPPLPTDAVHRGYGKMAIGQICRDRGDSLSDYTPGTMTGLLISLGIAYLLFFRGKK